MGVLFVTVCVWVGGWFRGVAETGSSSLGWLYARESIGSLVSQEVRVIGVLRFVDVAVCNFAVAETMNHIWMCARSIHLVGIPPFCPPPHCHS